MKSIKLTLIALRVMAVVTFTALLLVVAEPRHAGATFSGLNGRISFARFINLSSTSIFSVRPDGSGEHQLTFDGPNQNSVGSNWSPDGSRITFDSDRFSNGANVVDIFTMLADGSDVVQLTSNAGANISPDYSPDGKTIAFESDRGQGSTGEGIYLMNAADGTNVRRVTVAPAGDADVGPHFSPDGKRIVFTRVLFCPGPTGRCKINGRVGAVHIVNVDGSGLKRVTAWGLGTAATDWSPDGSKLVFESRFNTTLGSKVDVLIMNLDGSDLVNLTNNPPIAFTRVPGAPPCSISDHAKFSPDGIKLVFRHTNCTGDPTLWALWIMNADGSGKQNTGVTVGLGGEGFPDWGTNQE